jgi:hypothetical protein
MTMIQRLGAGVVLVFTMLTAGCATTPPRYTPAPPDPVIEARIAQLSPMADLGTGTLIYQGPLPPNLAPVTLKTDALGDTTFLSTPQAVAQFGETRVRQHVVKDIKLCARVELRRLFLAERRRQTDNAEEYFNEVRAWRKKAEMVPYAGYAAGAAQAWRAFGQDYGMTYLLGTLVPGVTNQAIYSVTLDENDVNIALNLADKRQWFGDVDLWLDSMDQWCPAFMTWVSANGTVVDVSQVTTTTVPAQPSQGP